MGSGRARAALLVGLLVVVGQLVAPAGQAAAAVRRLAYVCYNPTQAAICAVDEDGSHRTVLISDPGRGDYDPTWSPDGRQIVFDRSGDLAVMNADGSGVHSLLSKVYPGRASWSPDGTLIAYSDLGKLSVIRPDGSGRRQLGGGFGGQVTWSPDGRSLVFQGVVKSCKTSDEFDEYLLAVYTLDVATGATRQISPKQSFTGRYTYTYTSGTWTPGSSDPGKIVYDGEQIFIYTDDDGVLHCSGHSTPQLYFGGVAKGAGAAPAFSPDGARLAWWRRSPSPFTVLVGDRTGAGAKELGGGITPSWRPTGGTTPKPACSNGRDDDGDGRTDYPADRGCTSAADTSEAGPPTVSTSLTLNYANGSTIRANGQMTPKVSPGHVDVTLQVQGGGGWRNVETKHPTLSAQGRYVVSFGRPSQWLCRLDAQFPGDDTYLPSSTSKTFSC